LLIDFYFDFTMHKQDIACDIRLFTSWLITWEDMKVKHLYV